MRDIKSLCVYCGSSSGGNAEYTDAAKAFGTRLAQEGIALVYGGGKVGLMGTVADAVLAAGGRVIGVIPRQLVEKEVAHIGLSELQVVETMHERKTRMYELSDAFVALPGGFGTMDEIFECATLIQTGKIKNFPLILMGTEYWQPLHDFLCHRMVPEKTILPADCDRIIFTDSVDEAMERILSAATHEFGLVWQAAPQGSPRWYLGEGQLQRADPEVDLEKARKAG